MALRERWRNLGLRAKFVLVLAALAAAGLVTSAWLSLRAIHHTHRELSASYTRDATLLKRERIQTPFARELALALQMARSERIQDWLRAEQDQALKQLAWRDIESFRSAFVSGTSFVAVDASGNYYFNDRSGDFSDQPRFAMDSGRDGVHAWYRPTLNMPGPFNTNVAQYITRKTTNVWINVPIRPGQERSAQPIGLLGTAVEMTGFLREFIQDSPPGMQSIIVNQQGAILAHPDPNRISHQANTQQVRPEHMFWQLFDDPISLETVRETLRAAEQEPLAARPREIELQGSPTLIAASYLPDLKWFVVNLVDLEKTRVIGNQLWYVAALVLVMFLLGVVVLTKSVGRFLLQPLEALQSAARRVASGDYALQLTDAGGDEIGELNRAFNHMAAQIRSQTTVLEGRVRERTASLEERNLQLADTYRALEEVHGRVSQSIQYARRIQDALLPERVLGELRSLQVAAFWRPKDVVGGDFYLCKSDADGYLLGVVDCAGHSVPGALMTMLGSAVLDRALSEHGLREPARILATSDQILRNLLHADRQIATSMEAGLLYIDLRQRIIRFSGARMGLFAVDAEANIQAIAGGRRAIGDRTSGSYVDSEWPLRNDQLIVMCSDGVLDQNGANHPHGFGYERLHDVMRAHAKADPEHFVATMASVISKFQGGQAQRDDMTLLALRSKTVIEGAI